MLNRVAFIMSLAKYQIKMKDDIDALQKTKQEQHVFDYLGLFACDIKHEIERYEELETGYAQIFDIVKRLVSLIHWDYEKDPKKAQRKINRWLKVLAKCLCMEIDWFKSRFVDITSEDLV